MFSPGFLHPNELPDYPDRTLFFQVSADPSVEGVGYNIFVERISRPYRTHQLIGKSGVEVERLVPSL